MNILAKLAELANAFDKKGLFDEAAVLDQIVREAVTVGQLDKVYGKQFGEALLDRVYFSGNLTTIEKAIEKEIAKGTGLVELMGKVKGWDARMPDASGEMRKILGEFGDKKTEIAQARQEPADQGVAGETEPKVSPEQAKINEKLKRIHDAGKKAKRDPKIKAEQMKYNQFRKELFTKNIMTKEQVKAKFPWVKPDGIWGRQTKKMRQQWMPGVQQAMEVGVAAQTQQRAVQERGTQMAQQKEQQLQKAIQQMQQAYKQERLRRPDEVPAGQEAKIEEMMRNMTGAQVGMDLGSAMEALSKNLKL